MSPRHTRWTVALVAAMLTLTIAPWPENQSKVDNGLTDASERDTADNPDDVSGLQIAAEDKRPDIVLVVADDMRWDITSGQGHPYVRTPHLDQFAVDAARMNNAFVPVALCSPSRASILTGREPHQASAPGILWRNNSFLQTQRTFAEDLQAAGYTTAYIGKWHMGDGSKPKPGFDHWESFDWLGSFFDPIVHINGEAQQFTGYVDDILAKRADDFLKSQADSEKPVFLMVGLKAPHLQFESPVRYDHEYADDDIPKPSSYFEDFSTSGKQQAVKDWLGINDFACGLACFDDDWNTYIKKHYRAILGLDDSVGTLRAALKHRKKSDNTLFIYTSDNGYTLGEHGLTEKHMIYEEPVRVPFLVDFPGDNDHGYRFDGLVSTLDIAPTALDYAQASIPDYMTGRSLKPLMEVSNTEDDKRNGWRDELFMFYTGWQVGVRTDRYKYIVALNEDDHIELYDLQTDPEELQSVHDEPTYADVLAQMQRRLAAIIKENEWARRVRSPITKVLVSSPIDRAAADEIAKATSQAPTPSVTSKDTNAIVWREVTGGPNGFNIGQNVPANSTVLVALPMQRTVDWDPHTRIFLKSRFMNAMYVGGESVWDNYKRRPLDLANPPMVEHESLVIMSVDGEGSIFIDLNIEAPEGYIVLPLESDTPIADTARRRNKPDWLDDWNKQNMCNTETE